MKYGSLSCAKEYGKRGEIEQWLQLFLRNDGKNMVFADGLLLEERRYLGPMKASLSIFDEIEAGAPHYLTDQNSIDYFFYKVDKMKDSFEGWDLPPLIVNFSRGHYEVNDGRHRLETLRQLGKEDAYVIYWTTGDSDYEQLKKNLACNDDTKEKGEEH